MTSLKPTVTAAVSWLVNSKTNEYRRAQIAEWRTQFGDSFADQVRSMALAEIREPKKQKGRAAA